MYIKKINHFGAELSGYLQVKSRREEGERTASSFWPLLQRRRAEALEKTLREPGEDVCLPDCTGDVRRGEFLSKLAAKTDSAYPTRLCRCTTSEMGFLLDLLERLSSMVFEPTSLPINTLLGFYWPLRPLKRRQTQRPRPKK